ncbi:MAG: amino acid adenylation domain-containing protein [Sulfuricellaceae bacterium]
MNAALLLLSELEALDVRLSVEAGRLRYSAPKGVMTQPLLARLGEQKEALVALLEQRALDNAWDEAPIPRQPRGQGLPLSTAQQRFWFLDRLDRGNSATFVMPPIVLRLCGKLNVQALEHSLNSIVQRHEVLRSAFRIEGDAPVQIVLSGVELALPLHDLSADDPAAREQEVARVIQREAMTPFDLQRGEVLMRALLLKLAADEHCFILTMHHIISDGWSMGILVEELSQLYRAFAAGQADSAGLLPELPIQYADYAHWERARMNGERLARLQSYWLDKLEGAPTFLELPTDHPRPKVRSNRGQAVHFHLDADFAARLGKLCAQAGATPFMALLAGFGVLLCRYADTEELVIGSPIAVRPHSQTEGLIGLFLNTLAFRLDLSGNPTFLQLLERVRKTALEAYEHREMPFDQLLQALDLERSLDHTPLFQVLFALQNAPMGEVTLEGLSIAPQPTETLHAPFDLVLSMEETAQGINGFFRYNCDLFEQASVTRMTAHFKNLLEGLIGAPGAAIRTLPMLNAAEVRELRAWRGGEARFPADGALHRSFALQAGMHPAAVAVRYEDAQLTYRQLDERANRVAQRLRRMGVARGGRVGLCVERSLELVVGILGILKVGAAYVPLDPSYPEDRLRYMAQDSGLEVVLAHRATPPVEAAVIDLADPTLADEAPTPPEDRSEADDVAYVIYTSGSTGRPKGVEVTHANVLRLFTCSESLYGFGADDVWSLFHSYAFDFSVWELWGALLYGGQLVVAPFAVSRSPDQFHAFLRQTGVTVLNQTPSAFRQLIEADRRLQGAPEGKLALKWVIFGGEALDPRSLSGWVDRHGLDAPRLINMYGITETTVHTTFHRLTAQDIAAGGSVIGRPLPDLSIELVDRYGQLVPVGVGGEILVGGAGVAKGYLNLPELTAERFTLSNGERQYHSGDLARWRADGQLEYLGRIDHQVKVRGFRIELGEIESCLAKHAQVSDAVVEAREETAGARLIAYVASRDWQDEMLPSKLRAHLKALLPDYMVPAVVLVLERLPLTANGKLDRKALANLLAQFNAAGAKAVPASAQPRTPIELLLAELWSSVLNVANIGIDDNFFELGGDSIRGAILANKIQERIRSVVYVVALFEAPTIRQLVDYLRVHYPEAMARLGGASETDAVREVAGRVDEKDVEAFRSLIPPTARIPAVPKKAKNPRMIFVLSPPRSGSTLLRVLLGGHPQLFSPPELELLNFDTLAQRKEICSGRDAFWLEGTLRAVMEALQVDADEAKRIMAARENRNMSVKDFYGELQSWLPGRVLVDKSPSYALDVGLMQRAEDYFDEPLYIHLHRHPYGMISSFEEAKLNQIFFRYPHNLSVRRLAELIWLQSHRNIAEFLAGIPTERQFAISFEAISQKPGEAVKNLCEFLGIDFVPDMLGIYEGQNKQNRMTDGIYRESKMLGDIKFHTHKRIDPTVAERWRDIYQEDFLGEPSWGMAERLGYARLSGTAPIEPVARSGALPLSFAQQRLWFLDQLEGAGTAYNMPVALRIKGALNRRALAASLRAITERHEVLRSRFETVDGVPVVRVADALPDMAVFDLSGLAAGQQEQEIMRRVREDAEQNFDLARGPLFRSTLLILGENDHVVLVNMHHIVSDGWSMGVMVDEWSKLYNAAAAGLPAPLPPLPIQYADYAHWQRNHLAGAGLTRQLGYWRTRLAGAPALLELPTDRPRPAIQRFSGDTLEMSLDATLSAQLKRYADQSGVSRYMLLMAAFAVLLARYSGQRDIVLGSPTANRSRNEVEALIGFFVNTLVMRLTVAADQPFGDFLAHVRQMSLEAYAHQDVPFEQLVEELRPQRNLSYSPLFQVMFSMQNTPSVAPALNGLDVAEIPARQVVAKYDLTLALTERNGVLEAVFEYNTDLFERATVARLANHYANLLKGIIAAPHQSVDRLPLLSTEETACIADAWNRTEIPFAGAMTLHGLFEAQVLRTPDAIAVQFRNHKLTYRELDQRAEQLAQRLRAAGLAPGGMAAIAVARSLEMLIGLLAILKTGSAYVPLDPTYPPERIRYVLNDAGVSLLVTQSQLVSELPAVDCRLFLLDKVNEADGIASAPPTAADEAALAYVIYTSGSTGNPKGVMISHRAAANFLHSMRETPGIRPTDTVLAVTTISFDIAVLELYLPLSVGAKIVIADEAMTRDAESLKHTIKAERITLMQATPATWRLLLAIGWQGSPELKILCGGEAMPSALAKPLLACCASLWNMYGPTETTVWSTVQQVTQTDLAHATIPIGRPIANTRIYILDAGMGIQPVGVTGELYIGGDGLAAGYRHRPDLTAERFIPDPYTPGQRLYRTGDLARYLADGRIEYLGRGDQQVKVRGFRVELGEIEHILARQPGIAECAVGLDSNAEGDARLVAYYVGETTDVAALKRALHEVLPDYMTPSLFVRLPAMPLTPNGKIDRKALRPPEGLHAERAGERAGFRDAIELELVRIWEEVLNVRPIGIRDNFFDLGGHSIIAVRLMAKVAQQFGRQLPLSSLFQGATVEAMARLLRSKASHAEWSSVVPIQTQGKKAPFFCAAGAGGNVVYFHGLAQAMSEERPFFGLQPPGLDGVTPPHASVEDLAAHYLDAIERERQETPLILAGHSFGGLVAYEMARKLSAAGKHPDALVLLDTPAPHFFQPTGADWSESKWLAQVSDIVSHLYGVDVAMTPEQLDAHDNDAQLALLHDRLTTAGVLPEGSDIRYFRGFVDVYKANLRASYTPQQLTENTRVLLLRSQQEQPEHLTSQQFAAIRASDDLGWQSYFSQPITVTEVPGDHLTMMHVSNAEALAATLAAFFEG